MISREELQQVKDYTRANKEVVNTDRCLWGDRGGVRSVSEDNQRVLDLLEAAEHYAREDALREVKVLPLDFNGGLIKAGDRVRLKRNFPNDSLLREGQEVVVYDTCDWVSVMGPDDRHWVIGASSVERIEPDTQERIDADTQISATDYCVKCEHLLQRQRELDKKLFGGE